MSIPQPVRKQQDKQPTQKPVRQQGTFQPERTNRHPSISHLSPRTALQLQQSIGNRATIRLLGETRKKPVIEGRSPDVIQRVNLLNLRDIKDDYDAETIWQSPALIHTIRGWAKTLKTLYDNLPANQADYDEHLDFLERQDVVPDVVSVQGVVNPTELNKRLVKYDESPEEQGSTLIVGRGTLYRSDSTTLVDTADSVTAFSRRGWEIFVMSPSGEIHMTSHKIGLRHHSSMLAGGATAAAGEMKVTNGVIDTLTPKSGHYRPGPAQIHQMLHILKKRYSNPLNFTLDLSLIGGTTHNALTYWNSQGVSSFEADKTWQAWKSCVDRKTTKKKKGEDIVKKKFLSKKWAITVLPTMNYANPAQFLKPDKTSATQKEIRAFLKKYFGKRKFFEKILDSLFNRKKRGEFDPRYSKAS
jgi:hypothetical protein